MKKPIRIYAERTESIYHENKSIFDLYAKKDGKWLKSKIDRGAFVKFCSEAKDIKIDEGDEFDVSITRRKK